MENDRKHQRMVFIMGISLGLVLGGAVVFFSQNTQIIKYPIEVSQNTVEKIVNRVMGSIKTKNDSLKVLEEKKYKTKGVNVINNRSFLDSTDNQSTVTDTLKISTDTLHTASANNNDNADNIQVRKDELLGSKTLEVNNFDFRVNANNKDSLLQAASGIQIDKKNRKKINLAVEFWKSPLNYRGYKLFKNKLVLFGLDPLDEVVLVYSGDFYYLKCSLGIFKLSITDDFRSYERVTNPSVNSLFEL